MGSIPLPALDVKPPEQQPNLLSQYAQLQALKNQQVMQPLQQQAAQQQVQTGALELQQRQIALKDQQAMSATMQQWGQGAKPSAQPPATSQPSTTTQTGMVNPDTGEQVTQNSLTVKGPATSAQSGNSSGASASTPKVSATAPSYDDLVPLAIKNGASFQAMQGLQQHVLEMKQKASTIAMDDARTGQFNAEAMKTKNGLIVDAMTGVLNTPDEQLPQAIQQTAQQLAQQGLFDPPHVQQAQQLAQLAQTNPQQARQALTVQANSLGAFTKLIDDSQKQVQIAQEKGKSDPTSPFYAPSPASVALGTAPGAAQIVAGEAKEAGAKAGAEAAARQPFEVGLARLRQAIQDGDPRSAAQLLIDGDIAPSQIISARKPEFAQQAFQAAHNLSGGAWNAQQADANFAVAKSPANVQFFGSAKSLTDPGGTLDQLKTIGKTLPQNKLPVFNTIEDWEKAQTGSGPVAKFASVALGVADDYAKVMGGGQGTDTSRLQILKTIAENHSPEQRDAALEGIRGAVGSQINSRIGQNPVMRRMYGSAVPTQQGAQPQQGGQGQQGTPDPFAQFGGKAH